jgi:hypothetical protein
VIAYNLTVVFISQLASARVSVDEMGLLDPFDGAA